MSLMQLKRISLALLSLFFVACQTTQTIISTGATQAREDIVKIQSAQTEEALTIQTIKEEHKELQVLLTTDEQKEVSSLIEEHIVLLEQENEEQRQEVINLSNDISDYEETVAKSETEKAELINKVAALNNKINRYKIYLLLVTFTLILCILIITTTIYLRFHK